MTESEARDKWCPMTFNRGTNGGAGHCSGSLCMAFVKRRVPRAQADVDGSVVYEEDCHCGLVKQVW